MWHTRTVTPKGKYYLYAVVTSGGHSYMCANKPVVNLLEDTDPPASIDNPNADALAPQKFLQSGHLFIQRDSKTYSAIGIELR